MYAIIRTGGKQYKVQPGDVIRVEKLENELGSEFDLTEVLMVGGDSTVIGKPVVQNAKVTVIVTKQTRNPKVIVFKKKRRQGYRRFKTHRQFFTELFVKAISHDGKTAKTDTTANVVDVEKRRAEQIAARSIKSNTKAESAGEKIVRKTATSVKKKAASGQKKKTAGAAKSKKTAVKKKTAKKA